MTAAAPNAAAEGLPVFLAIDGAHCDRIRKALGVRLKFVDLIRFVVPSGGLARAVYYRDLRDEAEVERQSGLFQYLRGKGIEVQGSRLEDSVQGPRERYGTNLVELAVETLCAAEASRRVVLLAGDKKLLPLVRALRQRRTTVTLATALQVPEAVRASDALLSEVSDVVDLTDHILTMAAASR